MTNSFLGAALMAAPIMWVAWMLLKSLRTKERTMEIDLVVLVLAALCWMAGRVIAGKSMFDLLLG